MSRTQSLYEVGMAKYHELVQNEMGDHNAIIAAVAAIVASAQEWKPARLFEVDDGPEDDDWGTSPTVNISKPKQLDLPGFGRRADQGTKVIE